MKMKSFLRKINVDALSSIKMRVNHILSWNERWQQEVIEKCHCFLAKNPFSYLHRNDGKVN